MKSNISIALSSKHAIVLQSFGIKIWGWLIVIKGRFTCCCFSGKFQNRVAPHNAQNQKKAFHVKTKKKVMGGMHSLQSSTWAENIKVWKAVDWGWSIVEKWNSRATGERDTFVLTFLPPLGTSCLLFCSLVPFFPQVPGSHYAPCELWDTLQVLVACSTIARASVIW